MTDQSSELITLPCTGCGLTLRVPVKARGKTVKCKRCECRLTVPTEESVAEAVRAPQVLYGHSVPPAEPAAGEGYGLEEAPPCAPAKRSQPGRAAGKKRRKSRGDRPAGRFRLVVLGVVAGVAVAAGVTLALVLSGRMGEPKPPPTDRAQLLAGQERTLPNPETTRAPTGQPAVVVPLVAAPAVQPLPPSTPQAPVPAPPSPGPKSPLSVQLALFGPARFEQEEFRGRPLTGVVVEIEALTPNATGRFEASSVTAFPSAGLQVPAAVLFTAGGREGLAATAQVLPGSVGKSGDVSIGKERFQPESQVRSARGHSRQAPFILDKGQAFTVRRDGSLDSASTPGAAVGRVHLPPGEMGYQVGDFLVSLPVILEMGGGIEYGFVPGKKVRLGLLFAAAPENLNRLKLLGQTLELEPAKRSGGLAPTFAEPKLLARRMVTERARPSVALIEGKYGHGSGFLVLPNVVATNSHVIRNDLIESVTVRFTTGRLLNDKGLKARLLYEDKSRDLVLLALDGDPGRPPLPISQGFDPGGRPEVFVVGSPGQNQPGLALANVVAEARCDEEVVLFEGRPYYRLTFSTGAGDILIGPGNSGGPAVDRTGEVIGVVTLAEIGRDRRPAGRAYCIPSRAVQDAVEAVGPVEDWEPRIKLATARHALDIAAINVYANTLIGFAVCTARTKVPWTQAGPFVSQWIELKQDDYALIKAFQSADKRFWEIGQPAVKVAFASSELTNAQRGLLLAMQKDLEQIRMTVRKNSFPLAEYKRAQAAQERCRKAFDKICEESGMSKTFTEIMLETVLREAGIEIK